MQQQNIFNSSESARLLGLNNTTVQRAIQRGELAGFRVRDRSPFQIERAELLRWAADKGFKIHAADGTLIDPATGEVVEADAEPTPIVAVTAARARLAGVAAYESAQLGPVAVHDGEVVPLPAARVESNVARVLLPSADAGLIEAARRLVALPESPQLWQALRAVLGVEAPA